jgi:putative intracellular protease/amidase
VVFATEHGGRTPSADPLLLSGVLLGRLGARPEPVSFYRQLQRCTSFTHPRAWAQLKVTEFDTVILPGGHAPGMRQYLSSPVLTEYMAQFWQLDRPVAAICHGVLVLARTRDSHGLSVLAGRRTTCLPKHMERSAYYLTAWKLGRYYRTYPAYVEDEVTSVLGDRRLFERGPRTLRRGTSDDHRPAFVVQDGNYLSARWPGDAYLFAQRFDKMLTNATGN